VTEPRTLTQQHRAQQLLLRRTTVGQVKRIWPMLDWARLDATYPVFAATAARLVEQNRRTSGGLTAGYLRAFRTASGIPGEARATLGGSLRATTIAAIKTAAANGIAADIAMANGLTQASGAVARLVLDGGRETFMGTIQNDSAASGWQRVLGGAGCDFCAMLADRGAVYKEDTADFASHDHCGCSAEPSYGGSPRTVKAYVPSAKNIPDADRARVRAYLRDHPRA
jgi:hypothetical protein